MSDFAPGDLVVCVDDSPPRYGHRTAVIQLVAGRHYRISEAWTYPGMGLYVLVDGEPPHIVPGFAQPSGWNPHRFRKIDKADEGFSARMKTLRPMPAKTPANAQGENHEV